MHSQPLGEINKHWECFSNKLSSHSATKEDFWKTVSSLSRSHKYSDPEMRMPSFTSFKLWAHHLSAHQVLHFFFASVVFLLPLVLVACANDPNFHSFWRAYVLHAAYCRMLYKRELRLGQLPLVCWVYIHQDSPAAACNFKHYSFWDVQNGLHFRLRRSAGWTQANDIKQQQQECRQIFLSKVVE